MAKRGAGMQPKIVLRRPSQRPHPGLSSKGQRAMVNDMTQMPNWKPGKASSGTHKTD